MLHDPSHITPVPVEEEIVLSRRDKDVLRCAWRKITLYREEWRNDAQREGSCRF